MFDLSNMPDDVYAQELEEYKRELAQLPPKEDGLGEYYTAAARLQSKYPTIDLLIMSLMEEHKVNEGVCRYHFVEYALAHKKEPRPGLTDPSAPSPTVRTATPQDFENAANKWAANFWWWAIVAAVIGYFFKWWAIAPGLLALYSAINSVVATSMAGKMRDGTYRWANPNAMPPGYRPPHDK